MSTTPAAGRAAAALFATVTLLVATVTAALITRPPGAIPGWGEALLAPGAVGFMLTGGVHSGLPDWIGTTAWSLTNGVAWALLVTLVAGVYRAVARR